MCSCALNRAKCNHVSKLKTLLTTLKAKRYQLADDRMLAMVQGDERSMFQYDLRWTEHNSIIRELESIVNDGQ